MKLSLCLGCLLLILKILCMCAFLSLWLPYLSVVTKSEFHIISIHIYCASTHVFFSHSHPVSGIDGLWWGAVWSLLLAHGSLLEDYFLFSLHVLSAGNRNKKWRLLYFQKLVYGYILRTLFFIWVHVSEGFKEISHKC